jgi:hypothetical protein
MNLMTIGQVFSVSGELSDVSCSSSFLPLASIRFDQGFIVGNSFGHKIIFREQMLYEELAFIVLSLLIDPEFFQWNVRISVVLTEVRELLIDVASDIAPIDYPYVDVATLIYLLYVFRHIYSLMIVPFNKSDISCSYSL